MKCAPPVNGASSVVAKLPSKTAPGGNLVLDECVTI